MLRKATGAAEVLELLPKYSAAGRRLEEFTHTRGNPIQLTDPNGNVNKFEYDRANRLVREILPLGQVTRLTQAATDTGGLSSTDTEDFTLDAVGNRIAHSRQSGASTYDANNRLTQRGSDANATTYQYDDAGNLTQKTEPGNHITHYHYDTQNRLIEVTNGTNQPIARYGYDPLNRRNWKEHYRDNDGNAISQARRTYYLYTDEGLIAEATQDITLNADNTTTANGAPVITAQYGPRPESAFTTGTLFIKTKNSHGHDMVAYYHHDHLSTPIQATDKAGNLVWAARYNAFGQASITTPAATADRPTISSNLRLPGQYFDEETGLHYNYHRYYDPGTGRYITSDPIGLEGGINTYTYVGGNPLSYIDPTGLNAAGAAGGAAILFCARYPNLCRAGASYLLCKLFGGCDIPDGMHNESADDEGESCPANPPNIDDFDDPDNLPKGWDWRGRGEPGSREGAYHNPTTGESLHDDRTHPPGRDPHITYTDPNGTRWDNFGDGWVKQ